MDTNSALKEIFEYTLGLDVIGLENRYRELVELISDKTLVTFGNYIPCVFHTLLNLGDKSAYIREDVDRIGREYYLNDPVLDKFNLKIMDMLDVEYTTGTMFDPEGDYYYSSIVGPRHQVDLMTLFAGAELTYGATMAESAIPFRRYEEYRGNRVVYLKHYPDNGSVDITLRIQYPNIASIPEGYREVFIQLAIYDVKIKLYNELKYIEDVVTPAGNLNLKISDWEGAERDRIDYIERLRAKSFPDRIRDNFFTLL